MGLRLGLGLGDARRRLLEDTGSGEDSSSSIDRIADICGTTGAGGEAEGPGGGGLDGARRLRWCVGWAGARPECLRTDVQADVERKRGKGGAGRWHGLQGQGQQ